MIWNRREWLRGAGLSAASAIGQDRFLNGETIAARPEAQAENVGLFHARSFGARADGISSDTAALQAAIDAAHEKGGGTVYLAAGRYLSGTLRLRSSVSLWIDNGATLVMSASREDFPAADDASSAADRPESNETSRALLLGDGVHNIAVYGEGEIEGNRSRRGGPKPVFLRDSSGIALRGITFRNAPNYTVSLFRCRRAVIEGVTILNGYADGIDLDCCREVRVSGCMVESVDDAICLKASRPSSAQGVTEQIAISDCMLRTASIHFKCGTESCGDFRAIAVSNCTFEGGMGLRHGNPGIALYTVDGGNLEDIAISNIVMRDVATPFAIMLGNRDAWQLGRGPGLLRGVRISNVIASGTRFPSIIAGLPGRPVTGIHFSDMTVRMTQTRMAPSAAQEESTGIPENPAHYPEPNMFGPLPAFGLYLRHLAEAEFRHIRFFAEDAVSLPAIAGDDLDGLYLELLSTHEGSVARLHALRNSFLEIIAFGRRKGPMLHFSGDSTAGVFCRTGGSIDTKSQITLDADLPPGAVEIL
ncbi:glycoside hydrolase family 28 protein [Paracidobacterium acidisoli]|nr:glycosyl hydrolase family 28-related protein [Paracidobacterium acidisoli]MBT9331521.1 hypothetical protein [Paracidobacterium acidisoli]